MTAQLQRHKQKFWSLNVGFYQHINMRKVNAILFIIEFLLNNLFNLHWNMSILNEWNSTEEQV